MRTSRGRYFGFRVWSGEWLSPLVIGGAMFIASPSVTAYSDVSSMLAGDASGAARWNAHLTTAPAGAVQAAELPFDRPILTGSIANSASVALPDGRRVVFQGKIGVAETSPDEDRVTRGDKMGRVLAVAPVQPPPDFSAGALFQKSSSLLAPVGGPKERMAFVRPAIVGKEVEIASVFYRRQPRNIAAGVPTMLAGLVNNARGDVLATAYAETKPDYARQSPFDSLLKSERRHGRFVPPLPVDNPSQDWVATPLPPAVFKASEQRCLTAGVYFEARGEPLKGQAAVAQVILNRVRNPAYPSTICGVVYQNEDWRNRCQFSFACDGIRERVASKGRWKIAEDVAMAVTAGRIWLDDVGSSTHYHAVYVHPRWAREMKKVDRIGLHVFYETYNGGWD